MYSMNPKYTAVTNIRVPSKEVCSLAVIMCFFFFLGGGGKGFPVIELFSITGIFASYVYISC